MNMNKRKKELLIEFEDYDVKKVIGMDIEQEDREVGIFGNQFCLCLEVEDKTLQLHLFDEEMLELLRILKPFYLEEQSKEELDKYLGEQK